MPSSLFHVPLSAFFSLHELVCAHLSDVLLPFFFSSRSSIIFMFSKLVRTLPDSLGLIVGILLGGLGVHRNFLKHGWFFKVKCSEMQGSELDCSNKELSDGML